MRHTPCTPPGTLHRIPGGAYITTRTKRGQESCVHSICEGDPPAVAEPDPAAQEAERLRKEALSQLMRTRAAQAVAARRARAAAKQAAQAEAPRKPATGGRPRPGSVPYQPPVKPRRTRLADRPLGPAPTLERPASLPDWVDWQDGATVITARLIRVLWASQGRDGPMYRRFSLSDAQVELIISGGFPGGDSALREAWLQTFGAPQDKLDR
jgi:hypothetical protein